MEMNKTELYTRINDLKMTIYDDKHIIMIKKHDYQKQFKFYQDNKSKITERKKHDFVLTLLSDAKKELELHVKFYENNIKLNKLSLLLAEKDYNDTLNDKLYDMISNKKKEAIAERMEIIEEMAEVGVMKDGQYLNYSNQAKEFYDNIY
jgi:hypothetical protein